jgi:hypothetical protein
MKMHQVPGEKKKKTDSLQSNCDIKTGRKNQDTTFTLPDYFCSSGGHHGDVFSVQELSHLPIISSEVNLVPRDAQCFQNSPQCFSLVTPERRHYRETCNSSGISKRSSGFGSMLPSPSKLFFSPMRQPFSPSIASPLNCTGKYIFDFKYKVLCKLFIFTRPGLQGNDWREMNTISRFDDCLLLDHADFRGETQWMTPSKVAATAEIDQSERVMVWAQFITKHFN